MRACLPSKTIPHNRQPPWGLKLRSSTAFIVATVWMSTFTDFLLYAMIVPVMPTALMTRADVNYDDREYWVSVLLMCEASTALIFCPIFGYLVDRARTRQFFFLGALIMLAGCALVVVTSFALLNDSVSQERLGQSIGYLGSAIASGFLLGPFMGGIVYHTGGYDSVFYVAYFIIAVDMGMRVALVEKKVAERGQTGPRSTRFAMFKILRQRRVLISSWALLVQGIFLSSFDATLSIFVESRYGWSALGMGLIFLPMAIPAFFEPVFGFITDRFGARLMAFSCFLLLCPAIICLRFAEANSTPHIALLITLLFLIGIFIHACAPAMYVETQLALTALESADPGLLGPKGAVAQGFGLQSMCQFAGVFFGPLGGGFVEYRFGWGVMSAVLGVLAALTAVPMLWLGETKDDDEERQPLLSR
ncbi:Tetracycline resistance protein TetA/multidrug resistance protein MdtG [Penicillium maclennaniae]|uniref:Tetracycline resistance protein TetA/multidrug resistance protein MdtG n=1 Tax=Penicillium maclennaniae TaxID=1343394 RepID=UPI00253FCB28|nr:Tetracycline resistance protein TetA/multidrug resistance protein MdtG [Penicillium maclennaniae]KAJ5666253.1 Tetracycline resistance protein TetA/multidrug resistance protein MdtG [Penicillium maclennaniae]